MWVRDLRIYREINLTPFVRNVEAPGCQMRNGSDILSVVQSGDLTINAKKNPAWSRHLDSIADELVRLTAVCDVQLRDPGVVDRILINDETVCGKRNPIGFRKLRSLLVATYGSLNKAIDRLGPDEVKAMTDEIAARLDKHREAGGTKVSNRKPWSDKS
jgi:hypothetical protein